ncbi:MAG: leucyl aminopeptidase family protein [Alphaproteobacteria bacterium]|nr:leucyl aminopeptidase family protein [Alphaproteobacteria bacterium]
MSPIPLHLVRDDAVTELYSRYPWLKTTQFGGKPGALALLPAADGALERVFVGVGTAPLDTWTLAGLPGKLPPLTYALMEAPENSDLATNLALGWRLGGYSFSRKGAQSPNPLPTLVAPIGADTAWVETMSSAIFMGRDLINQPANELTPQTLAKAATDVANAHGAFFKLIEGAELLDAGYPLIHAVGKASAHPPCLIDFTWGDAAHRKVTLVGKGVTFDSGGLNIKPGSNMALMKKDMGGAAWVLALAQMIMALKLPIRLRVLIPAVENAVGGKAFRPGDILPSRKGITVEIGDTDAEGRLILADCLWEAAQEQPDLLIDAATLTGAQRVALGTDLPGFFTNRRDVAAGLMQASMAAHDPLWELPLFAAYRSQLDSKVADISNIGGGGYGGAITAALFLQEFVGDTVPWVHLDFMAWNLRDLPGRPVGGEVQGVRAVLSVLIGL